MSDRDPVGTDKDRALWVQLKASAPADGTARPPAVSDTELAAWLDGRLPPEAAARVEASLAADPAILDRALDAAAVLRDAAPPASDRLVTRAQALVDFQVAQPRSSGGLLAWLAGWRRQFEMAVVASAFLVVCVTGFSLGGGFQEAYAGENTEVSDFAGGSLFDSDLGFFTEQGGQQ
jgi:hypothetical protein